MRKPGMLEEFLSLPTPVSISIWWNGGSLLGLMLGIQILTGIFLSMHYTADLVGTFSSVIHIMRDVPAGWIIRSIHANGASFFFIMMYMHIARGLYYQSYLTQNHVWMVGVTIFLVSMATAFLGYVLPWGQMSFWGATVITNLLSAIPYFGPSLVEWVWGGFSINQATLNRFFSLHFLLPFLISLLAVLHIIFLHEKGSTSPLGDVSGLNKISFHPYFSWKDLVGFIIVLIMLLGVSLFYPNLLVDPENYINANPMVTPIHIQPEWYFLFAYAILRSIPSKLGGVLALLLSIIFLYFLPLIGFKKIIIGSPFNMPYQLLFWMFMVTFILLSWLGACPIEEPYLSLAGPLTVLYFMLPMLMGLGLVSWPILCKS
uniref:cytochrome b n=1 Tax=Rabdotus mooreanus TaxID=3014811 RepID=UPI00286D02C6|nr:cytochrome b [Rabdotus mooreanus]WLN31336.1 cytochrome b [Rabdotus mooreanus]